MDSGQPGFWTLAIKTIVAHSVTYFLVGLVATTLLNYQERFGRPGFACFMRQTDDAMAMAGPLFQPIRGLIFALALYPLQEGILREGERLAVHVVDAGPVGASGPVPSALRDPLLLGPSSGEASAQLGPGGRVVEMWHQADIWGMMEQIGALQDGSRWQRLTAERKHE